MSYQEDLSIIASNLRQWANEDMVTPKEKKKLLSAAKKCDEAGKLVKEAMYGS